MRGFDFSSLQGALLTLLGIAAFTLISMGIRLVMMMTIQQRRERANRQINERLKTLIAAYKTLGGSFTGNLTVDPRHLREIRQEAAEGAAASDRSRRIRDAVEAALSDILLLGTEEQVRLAERAARDLTAGKPVQTAELVVSLRDFIRNALDLDPVPANLAIPAQGPTRPSGSGGKGGRDGAGGRGGGGGGGGAGMGMGGGGMGIATRSDDPSETRG